MSNTKRRKLRPRTCTHTTTAFAVLPFQIILDITRYLYEYNIRTITEGMFEYTPKHHYTAFQAESVIAYYGYFRRDACRMLYQLFYSFYIPIFRTGYPCWLHLKLPRIIVSASLQVSRCADFNCGPRLWLLTEALQRKRPALRRLEIGQFINDDCPWAVYLHKPWPSLRCLVLDRVYFVRQVAAATKDTMDSNDKKAKNEAQAVLHRLIATLDVLAPDSEVLLQWTDPITYPPAHSDELMRAHNSELLVAIKRAMPARHRHRFRRCSVKYTGDKIARVSHAQTIRGVSVYVHATVPPDVHIIKMYDL